jgi:hypothetical protein
MAMLLHSAEHWHNVPFRDHETESRKPPFDARGGDRSVVHGFRGFAVHQPVHLSTTSKAIWARFLFNRTFGSVPTGAAG